MYLVKRSIWPQQNESHNVHTIVYGDGPLESKYYDNKRSMVLLSFSNNYNINCYGLPDATAWHTKDFLDDLQNTGYVVITPWESDFYFLKDRLPKANSFFAEMDRVAGNSREKWHMARRLIGRTQKDTKSLLSKFKGVKILKEFDTCYAVSLPEGWEVHNIGYEILDWGVEAHFKSFTAPGRQRFLQELVTSHGLISNETFARYETPRDKAK